MRNAVSDLKLSVMAVIPSNFLSDVFIRFKKI